ncbi:MAG TPA: HK97 family phage prohead protease [Candidatus Saccharibacteria bacterium]|nr:HK97 family phage prohead protease [Candidatus Saccharibacteria bacterium]
MSRKIDLNKLQHKSAGDKLLEVADTGRFSGYASVFGVLDDQGEIIRKGAYTDSLASYEESGKRFPVIYLHNLKEPVGYIEKAVEDDVGLWVEGVIMHETSVKAAEAYSFAKEGVISEMSVGFYYIPEDTVYDPETDITNIYKADLREVSLVVIGSNSGSRIVAVKSAGEENELAELVKVDAILSGIVANQQQQALAKIAELFK